MAKDCRFCGSRFCLLLLLQCQDVSKLACSALSTSNKTWSSSQTKPTYIVVVLVYYRSSVATGTGTKACVPWNSKQLNQTLQDDKSQVYLELHINRRQAAKTDHCICCHFLTLLPKQNCMNQIFYPVIYPAGIQPFERSLWSLSTSSFDLPISSTMAIHQGLWPFTKLSNALYTACLGPNVHGRNPYIHTIVGP